VISQFSPVTDEGPSTEKFTKEKANCPEFVKILTTERNFMEKNIQQTYVNWFTDVATRKGMGFVQEVLRLTK
jgi:hypothetical protein